MIHVALLLINCFIFCVLTWSAIRFAAVLWSTSDVVALPVICEEPARTHVENGELTFFFSYTPIERRVTMRGPEVMQ